jgi:two-component system response regulator VanR
VASTKPLKILIVDDDPPIRHLLRAVCRQAGYECELATDGADALDKIERATFDIVLLDLMMPRVNGFQVIEALRARPQRPRVIVITAQGTKQIEALDFTVVHAVLHKPFDLPALQKVMLG